MLLEIILFLVGFILGVIVTMILRSRSERAAEERRQQEFGKVLETVELKFGNLSNEALKKNTDEFLKIREALLNSDRESHARTLESKKELIDESLKSVTVELNKVQQVMQGLGKESASKFGELDSSLKLHQQQVQLLVQTTSSLREALASTKARGQWGERMAEDVLRLAGFIENVNYFKQRTMDGSRARPDFSFPLPHGMMLNMDVKFPLDNYLRYLEAGNETEESRYREDFIRDVRQHVKTVCGRDYINPAEKTVDYMILFIPNEQVYAFINQTDRRLLDEAMEKKVIVCSPLTLYAILAVVRQAADNFAFEQASEAILAAIAGFEIQWKKFCEKFDQMGKRLEDTQKTYSELTTTRARQLDRAIDKIQDLRAGRNIEFPPDEIES